MNIVLIGYRCSGKSAVGKIVAERTGMKLADTDQLLEKKVGCPIDRYVAEKGWECFRMMEKMVVRSVSGQDRQVIATGGGVVLDWENVCQLRDAGWLVWLEASVSTIHDRMLKDERTGNPRPGLLGDSPLSEIKQVLGERRAFYERACDLRVDTNEKSPDTVSEEILRAMPQGLGHLQHRNSSRPVSPIVAIEA